MEAPAVRPPIDDIPSFWREPWRFAAPAWRDIYGVPRCDFDDPAARLIYSGWAACFGLARRWRPPTAPDWWGVLRAPPALLHDLAATLGYLALARAGASDVLLRAARSDRASVLALKYRALNCMTVVRVAPSPSDPAAWGAGAVPHGCGVDVLRAMARQDWPDVEPRLAMLVAPRVPTAPGLSDEPAPVLRIDRVDVRRCLSVCGAVVRRLAGESALRGDE